MLARDTLSYILSRPNRHRSATLVTLWDRETNYSGVSMTKINTLYCVKFLRVVWWFNKFTWGLTVCNEHMRSFVKITVCVYAASNRTKFERVSLHHQLGKHDLATICVNSTLLPCKHVLWNNLLISEYDSFAFMAVLVPVRGVGYVFFYFDTSVLIFDFDTFITRIIVKFSSEVNISILETYQLFHSSMSTALKENAVSFYGY